VQRELQRRARAGHLPAGRTCPRVPARVTCRFSGTLNDKLRGFYRSTYTDDDGESHTIATTQFESVDARRAFPCWDEPDRKAVFEITLIVDRDVDAISNSPIVDVDRVGDKNRVRFSPTMKMSTYLVAFVVGKLETTETVDVDGVPLRVVFTPGKLQAGRLRPGQSAPSRCASSPSTSTSPTPGEKVDLVAIPDFAAGAMENLGCITFRDTALLIDRPRRPGRARAGGRRHRARAGAHVVRRPGDHGLVGGHLAQRGLRHLHGGALRRRLPAVVGPLGRLRPLPRGRPGR
jgi:aminopeptidase N